jgi:formylglycine-generating enzyme required for sulfatase activity/predicted small secreted protein
MKKKVSLIFFAVLLMALIAGACNNITSGSGDGTYSPNQNPDNDQESGAESEADRVLDSISGASFAMRLVPPTGPEGFMRDGMAGGGGPGDTDGGTGASRSLRAITPVGNVSVITKGYWMAETEVTQALFELVMEANPSKFQGSGFPPADGEIQAKRPVEQVNWYHAVAFCNRLSVLAGKEPVYYSNGVNVTKIKFENIPTTNDAAWNTITQDLSKNGYRLPTEMEWEWAAMGATSGGQYVRLTGYSKPFAGSNGSNEAFEYAWYYPLAGSKSHEVGKKRPNELGIFDLSGNVHEWCWDVRTLDNYPAGLLTDYTGENDTYPTRITRGGRHTDNIPFMAVNKREDNWAFWGADKAGTEGRGFRVVRRAD